MLLQVLHLYAETVLVWGSFNCTLVWSRLYGTHAMHSSQDWSQAYKSGIESDEDDTVLICEARLALRQAYAPAAPGIVDAAQDLSTSCV